MLKYLTLSAILLAAVWMDIRTQKISNRLIFFGLGLGLFFRMCEYGAMGVLLFLRNISIPVIVFYLLFLMHALGAGDIKLFSVISGFVNLDGLCSCIFFAFLFGAGIALVRMLRERSLVRRMLELAFFAGCVIRTGQITCYRKNRNRKDVICFSVSILMGYLCYLLEVVC